MGTWDVGSFDNDDAADWAFELEECGDLSVIEDAIASALDAGEDYLEAPTATVAIAAVETLARLQGFWGERSAYTEAVDAWVERVKLPVPPALAAQAVQALDRILGEQSELRELWEESEEFDAWKATVAELRSRVHTV
ncbi:MAG: DUF4259 domain-containing protein [Gemmatimonadaceae bacterium]